MNPSPPKEKVPPLDQKEVSTSDIGTIEAIEQIQRSLARLSAAWKACCKTERVLFLRDVRAGSANAWKEAEREFYSECNRKGSR